MGEKYDKIGFGYDLSRKADPFLTKRLVEHLSPTKSGVYLDIGCGTGNYTDAFQKRGFPVIGMDPSEKMLEKARLKNRHIDWRSGSAENTGLADNFVDGIFGTLTLHHWTDLKRGFSELHRVLKPNGRMVIFTATPEQMNRYWLNNYFPGMLKDSIIQMPAYEDVATAMKENGIEIIGLDKYFVSPDLQDKFLYCGKHDPELYFNEQIRNGISSFSSLANSAEVEKGLLKLRQDIDSGKINTVIRSYENDLGDYLYVIGEKRAASNV